MNRNINMWAKYCTLFHVMYNFIYNILFTYCLSRNKVAKTYRFSTVKVAFPTHGYLSENARIPLISCHRILEADGLTD